MLVTVAFACPLSGTGRGALTPVYRPFALEGFIGRKRKEKAQKMAHDRDYFRQRAAEARAAAFRRDEGEDAEVAGQLALAYTALARRQEALEKSSAVVAEDAET